jgi:alkanesulfonate monooxygenase SsuD/methylene tetrahydromethanopterin reductase-like flavin-dependent oxidoreductase (luciferase family)
MNPAAAVKMWRRILAVVSIDRFPTHFQNLNRQAEIYRKAPKRDPRASVGSSVVVAAEQGYIQRFFFQLRKREIWIPICDARLLLLLQEESQLIRSSSNKSRSRSRSGAEDHNGSGLGLIATAVFQQWKGREEERDVVRFHKTWAQVRQQRQQTWLLLDLD